MHPAWDGLLRFPQSSNYCPIFDRPSIYRNEIIMSAICLEKRNNFLISFFLHVFWQFPICCCGEFRRFEGKINIWLKKKKNCSKRLPQQRKTFEESIRVNQILFKARIETFLLSQTHCFKINFANSANNFKSFRFFPHISCGFYNGLPVLGLGKRKLCALNKLLLVRRKVFIVFERKKVYS